MDADMESWRDTAEQPLGSLQKRKIRGNRKSFLYPKVPSSSIALRSMVLTELRQRFQAKEHQQTLTPDRLQSPLHILHKQKPHVYSKRSLKYGGLLMKPGNSDNPVSDLVSEIQFSKLKIVPDPKIDYNINRGMATLNCYDNKPRRTITDIIDDGNTLAGRPDITDMLEGVNIECDTYEVNNSACTAAPCSEVVEKTESLKIDANVQNYTNSQVAVVDRETLLKLF